VLDLCVVGGLGRMGRAIAGLVELEPDIRIVSVWDTPEAIREAGPHGGAGCYRKNPVKVLERAEEAIDICDVALDFSLPEAFRDLLQACERAKKPLVTGTTGIEGKERMLSQLASQVAVVSAPNMSIGMNTLLGVCGGLGRGLAKEADTEIMEIHHRTKKDVPSGTALEIARVLASGADKRVVVGRPEGHATAADEIVIHSMRMGDVPGTHTIVFTLKGESLEITHKAFSRECFALGALRAARFVSIARPGLYSMQDVIAFT
jgi:4-hydroxy-tetrahydrodipicolinate reductase